MSLSVLIAAGRAALASDSQWINPVGGMWGDPANWSNGVPAADGVAVLPPLDGDGYVITVPSSAMCGRLTVTAEHVVLAGGSLQVAGPVEIGASESLGSLTLQASHMVCATLRIGTMGGEGSLTLVAQSQVGGGELMVGEPGPGLGVGRWTVIESSEALFGAIVLAPTATTTVEYNARATGGIIGGAIARGGTLTIVAPSGAAVPIGDHKVIRSSAPMTGAFGDIEPPSVEGYRAELIESAYFVQVNAIDPIVAFSVSPEVLQSPLYVGFTSNFTANGTLASGAGVTELEFHWQPDPSVAEVDGSALRPLTDGPFVLGAEVLTFGSLLVTSAELAASVAYPYAIQRVDLTSDGELPNETALLGTGQATMTADGRTVVFSSHATNLAAGSQGLHVFAKDRWTDAIEQIDVGAVPGFGNVSGYNPAISDNGRFVVFERNLPSVGLQTIWVRDRWTETTWLASAATDGSLCNDDASGPCIAADGSALFFATASTNVVAGVESSTLQIIRHDLATRENTLVSRAPDGSPANAHCSSPASSADGRVVVFRSGASNLAPTCTGGIVLWDGVAGVWEPIAVGENGCANGIVSPWPSISADGTRVAFASSATNLGVPSGGSSRVYLRDRLKQVTTPVSSAAPLGLAAFHDGAHLSANGETVVYRSTTIGYRQLHRVNMNTMEDESVCLDPWSQDVFLPPYWVYEGRPWISADGEDVVFAWRPERLAPFCEPDQLGVLVRHFGEIPIGDINRDGRVNAADLALLLAAWGLTASHADLDADGTVGAGDLAILLAGWTP